MASLTTHVLDTYSGTPAKGVCVQLWQLGPQGNRKLQELETNQQGRCELASDLAVGEYALHFFIGDYFKPVLNPAKPMFLNMVPIHFYIAEADQHFHVPLVASPWAYSTYRGS